MKNLNLSTIVNHKLHTLDPSSYVCIDESSGSYVCHNLKVYKYSNEKLECTIDLGKCVPIEESDIINMVYLSLQAQLCIALSTGEIVTANCDTQESDISAVCSDGIEALEWSLDQELLVIATRNGTMILMSAIYDPIVEINLADESFGEGQFINVGWGKKETQFHGSEGKAAAKTKLEIELTEKEIIKHPTTISWRGDGALFAIDYNFDGLRRFKVFDREGILQYTSEVQPGLGHQIAWKPSGSLIAKPQTYPQKYVISFFEKNGLKHGEFVLPFTSEENIIENLCWSIDSEILALQTGNRKLGDSRILICCVKNYHWYIKNTLKFPQGTSIIKIFWDLSMDSSCSKKLHVFLSDGSYLVYKWNWVVNHSIGNTPKDDAIVGVIDGKTALLTGFRHTVVPPPMAACQLLMDGNINCIFFGPDHSPTSIDRLNNNIDSNSVGFYLEDGTISLHVQSCRNPLQYKICHSANVMNLKLLKSYGIECFYPHMLHHWCWISNTLIVAILNSQNLSYLVEIESTGIEDSASNFEMKKLWPLADQVITSCPFNNTLLLQTNNGKIIRYSKINGIEDYDKTFPSQCTKLGIANIQGSEVIFGLSEKNRLYVDSVEVANNITSFFLHTDFLMITNGQNELICIELKSQSLNSFLKKELGAQNSEFKRKLERGSVLIVTVPFDTRTVLQLPRGNLETIQPRPLSLKTIGKYLDEFKYYQAFDLMRKQRINLNLFHDHDPISFMSNIEIFLSEIQNDSWLNLFISELEETDVTSTMYASCYNRQLDSKIVEHTEKSKVARICDTLRIHLEDKSEARILPILTSLVKKNNIEDLEKALLLVKQAKISEKPLGVGVDEALRHLLYMVDVNTLYDVALGLYDFDLVLLVANKSQKDPKEFVPFLNDLNVMEENYKKFNINKYLKRYKRALKCLICCKEMHNDELLNFIKQHSLYSDALPLCEPNSHLYINVSEAYALYLKLEKKHLEAGLMYKRANIMNKAIECFVDALEWQLAIELAKSERWDPLEFKELYWNIFTHLKADKRNVEALQLLERCQHNEDEIIALAVEMGLFKSAINLANTFDRVTLLDEIMQPALNVEVSNLREVINTNKEKFSSHRIRLSVVRAEKFKENNLDGPLDMDYLNKDSDLYSDTSSVMASSASRSSNRSFRSSKNRRKHERKLLSLKEGSAFEDAALIVALYNLVWSTFDLRLALKETVFALVCYKRDQEAMQLQKNLEDLLKYMQDHFKEIWIPELLEKNVMEGADNNDMQQGISSLEIRFRTPPVLPDIQWKLFLL